jgi:hypothetical protein
MIPVQKRAPESPVGEAFAWAGRIVAIGLVMFLPAVTGSWLDNRFSQRWIGLVGLALGLATGLGALLKMTRQSPPKSS